MEGRNVRALGVMNGVVLEWNMRKSHIQNKAWENGISSLKSR